MKPKIKIYLKGFLKGLGLTLLIGLLNVILHITLSGGVYDKIKYSSFDVLFAIGGIIYTSYLIYKHRFPYAWMLVALFLSWWTWPFLFGAIELKKLDKK
ncbi:MAG TPA: hypothetical protein VL401_01655 [Alphaproteobacteria bacterium]|jgi:hypothetical protein|nr:hypothetical protein [Alphaproteobacteria bacterium]